MRPALLLIFVVCSLVDCNRSINKTVTGRRSPDEIFRQTKGSIVCYDKNSWNGITFITYHNTESEIPRKFLEMYFDKPLAIRSFFHNNCPKQNETFLLLHTEHSFANNPLWFYGKSDIYQTVYKFCYSNELAKKNCLCSHGAKIALHAIESMENTDVVSGTQKKPLVLDAEQLHNEEYFFEFLKEFAVHFGHKQKELDIDFSVDRSRVSSVMQTLQRRVLRKVSKVEMQQDDKDIVSRCFFEQWLVFKKKEDALLMFPEIQYNGELLKSSNQRVSTLHPDVNILIPTKDPKNLDRCVGSLLAKADLDFGQLFFHFGVDFGDNKTSSIVNKCCKKYSVYCIIHEVYARAGDVSAIVNHMFMSIDQRSYFFRFNDDTEMLSKRWNYMAINALRQPPTDVGIAKIIDLTNPTLQTHSFVSSEHKAIFGYYFPIHFKNIYEDNWITDVYRGTLTKTCFVKIKHHALGVRYSALDIPLNVMTPTIQHGKIRISKYLDSLN